MTDDAGGESACFAHLLDEAGCPSDETLVQMIRDLADAVVICDRDGTIVFWNNAATRCSVGRRWRPGARRSN